jgi:hypothetical protein
LHGTVAGQQYSILSREFLTNSDWYLEKIIDGATNQDWTPTSVTIGARTNQLFFWAVSLGDSDADGIPDFWELEHQLDMNNAADANADPDGDGSSASNHHGCRAGCERR